MGTENGASYRNGWIPAAVVGFRPPSCRAVLGVAPASEARAFDNCYPEVARPDETNGTPLARTVMNVVDANWRGIGVIPRSGFALRESFAAHDARRQFKGYADDSRRRVGEMPPGCDCARVVLGQIYPNQCRLYGVACQPRKPIGPCMVSDEGACRIWWSSGVREREQSPVVATP
jgi:hydrogenase expression/formation protein HypD